MIQIDDIHMEADMSLVAAVGVEGNGDKHPLSAVEGATESNLARRPEKDWRGVSASNLEGVNEMLTVIRLGLSAELRRWLACANIIENVMGTVRRVCRKVAYWRSSSRALRWTGDAMLEVAKGFRRLKASKQLTS